MTSAVTQTRLTRKKVLKIIEDPREAARAVRLAYVSDNQEGIQRLRAGKGFRYLWKGKILRDKEQLDRIRSLVLPPAWEKVWICAKENGHLQATGLDARGRKQYRYHPLWTQLRNETKFYRMLDFGKVLPAIRRQLKKHLHQKELTQEKVLATVVALMEQTCIRVGNEAYEKQNGSIGLTTMKDRHVSVNGSSVKFNFVGKKGKPHKISMRNKKLAQIVRHCREIPGKELFQFYDEQGERKSIDSGMVNDYIRQVSGGDFTAKDFRTWAGTVKCYLALKQTGPAGSPAEAKRKFTEVLDEVAAHLGNTRTVCRKYYVHPCLSNFYELNKLFPAPGKSPARSYNEGSTALSPDEKEILEILRRVS
jgi:DNA topoisomerase-1